MTKLPTIDVGFLLTESHHSPKHVAGTANIPPAKRQRFRLAQETAG